MTISYLVFKPTCDGNKYDAINRLNEYVDSVKFNYMDFRIINIQHDEVKMWGDVVDQLTLFYEFRGIS